MIRRTVLIGAAALVTSCAALTVTDNFSGDLIRVPHDKHLGNGVDCGMCHEEIYDATTIEGNFRPPESKCMECHQDEKDNGNCVKCHTDVKRARAYPVRERDIRFAHKPHIERVKQDCTVCHKVLPDPSRHRDYAPKMAACRGCHNHEEDFRAGNCTRCHVSMARFPLKPVAEFSHSGNWVEQHPRDARSSSATCANCHEQTFCADCHAKTVSMRIELKYSEKVDSDFIHRGDFVDRHAIEVRADPTRCARCHGTSFCENCHRAQNLTPQAGSPRTPHPQGWAFPASPEFHGPVARRDISECAACHDQGPNSVCVTCHKVGGIGGNPHPAGYTDRHPRTEIGRNGMCLVCHP